MNRSFKSRLLRLVLTIGLAVLVIAVPACQPAAQSAALTKVTLALDWYPWSNHAPLYLARDRGYFRDEGLDVEIYTPSNPEDVLKLVGSGKDTFGISYQTDVQLARAEGVNVKSVAALVQRPLNSIMTLKSSGITHPAQLEGKKLGTTGVPSNEAFLATMMAADKADVNKVTQVTVGYDLVPALIGGQVDAIIGAYWVHESILAEEKGYPVNIIKVDDWGVPPYYELVLVAQDQMIDQKPEIVQKFVRAAMKGYADASKDHKAALDALFKASPETDHALETRGIELLAPLWPDESGRFGVQTADRWRQYTDWLVSHNQLKSGQDPSAAFTARFTEK